MWECDASQSTTQNIKVCVETKTDTKSDTNIDTNTDTKTETNAKPHNERPINQTLKLQNKATASEISRKGENRLTRR